jgi:hypothetical protein
MKELTLALLMWISSNTPLAYDGLYLPEVVSVRQGELLNILYDGKVPQGTDAVSLEIAGLYHFEDGTIYLAHDVDLATIEGKAVLVHELVHYLQYRHGLDRSVPCMVALERDAYAAQRKYLVEHGKTPDFNELHVALASTCWAM